MASRDVGVDGARVRSIAIGRAIRLDRIPRAGRLKSNCSSFVMRPGLAGGRSDAYRARSLRLCDCFGPLRALPCSRLLPSRRVVSRRPVRSGPFGILSGFVCSAQSPQTNCAGCRWRDKLMSIQLFIIRKVGELASHSSFRFRFGRFGKGYRACKIPHLWAMDTGTVYPNLSHFHLSF